jgi:CDP-6-deoxy-D-xylo-4-hexulose-3-dehydrase
VSNFSFPIITKNIDKLIKKLNENDVECRPLICGSINEHPFWYERYGKQELPNSKLVHEYGLYLPNNHQMTDEELDKVIKIVNENI